MKLGFKLTTIMILLSLFSIGSAGAVLIVQSSKTISKLAYASTFNLAESAGSDVKSYIDHYWYTAQTIAQVFEGFDNFPVSNRRNTINDMLRSLVIANSGVLGAWAVWEPDVLEGNDQPYSAVQGSLPNGRFAPFWYRSGTAVVVEVLDDFDVPGDGDYYLKPKSTGQGQLLDPYIEDYDEKSILVTTVAFPIFSEDGRRVLGVAGIDINVDVIQEIGQNVKPYEDAESAVYSNSGEVISHFDLNRVGKNMRETEKALAGAHFGDFINAVQSGEPLHFSNFIPYLKTDMNVFIVPIRVGQPANPWGLMVAVPESTIQKPVQTMMEMAIFASAFLLVIVIIAAFILSRSISRPIVRVADTLKDISEGEGDLTRSITVASHDEIGDLAYYFNETLEKIRDLIVLIRKQALRLSDTGNDLASNMTETAAAVNQITANIQSIKGRIMNQSASVSQTNATMEQVIVNINKLDTLVGNQSNSISSASSAIEEMAANIQSVAGTLAKNVANVETLSNVSEVGRAGLQEVVEDIQEIARDSEGLLEVNSVMENIASQTNLLSMNAAIEAAHAGQEGKGFAVVAEEIRKLAESSGEQSKATSVVLRKIRSSIEKITASTEIVLARFEAIDSHVKIVSQQEEHMRCAMDEQGEGSRQIVTEVAEINEITQQVKNGSDQMLGGSKEVITESRNLEEVTQEITSGMNEMAAGAAEINVVIHQVNEISNRNRDDIGLLLKEVSRFKVE